MELRRHAIEKLQTFGDERSVSRAGKLIYGFVIAWEGSPWVVILSNNGVKVSMTYPTDECTVANNRGGGRQIFPNN